jgi:hypothetical protein
MKSRPQSRGLFAPMLAFSVAAMLPSLALATLLIALGTGLMIWQVRCWRRLQKTAASERELTFARRQFSRRRQSSLLIVAVGIAVAVGELVTAPLASLCYWSGVLLLVLWIVGIALIDVAATQQYFGLHRAVHDAEELLLKRDLRRGGEFRQNGHPPADDVARPQ